MKHPTKTGYLRTIDTGCGISQPFNMWNCRERFCHQVDVIPVAPDDGGQEIMPGNWP
jgi:hypothetical protein